MKTTTEEQRKADAQKLAEIQRRQHTLNLLGTPTLGDLFQLGLFSFAGRLSDPRGWWHCPACWMDYGLDGQYCELAA